MLKALYSDTWDGLTLKMIGYYHDHCRHYYAGSCDDLPEKYMSFNENDAKYVFIYEEDEPYKSNES